MLRVLESSTEYEIKSKKSEVSDVRRAPGERKRKVHTATIVRRRDLPMPNTASIETSITRVGIAITVITHAMHKAILTPGGSFAL